MAYENRDYTHLSENEKQRIELIAQAIRNKAYGIDVRESIALAIEWVNREYKLTIENNILTLKEFENAKSKVSTLELDMDKFIKRYSGQIAGNTSLDETIDARVDATGVSHATLKDRLDKENQEVTAQLAETVRGETGKTVQTLAGVIRNTGAGWFYIDDEGHNRINMSAVSVQNGSIRVEHTGDATKVGALVATPDETFGKEGMIVGASVGNTFSLIDLFLPLNVQIKGDGTFVAKSYFTPSLALTFSADKSRFTLEHPEVDALDMPMLVSPMSAGSSGEFVVSYSGTSVTVERRGDLAGYIYYDTASSTWKYQGDNVNDLTFNFGGGVLTVNHSAVVGNLYGLVVSERDGGYKPIVVSPLTSSFQVKLKDAAGNTISTPDANCKFYFARIGAKYKMPFKPTERVVLKRGHAKVDATHVVNTSGNIWIHGLMQN